MINTRPDTHSKAKELNEGLFIYLGCMWVKGKTRKVHYCYQCGVMIKIGVNAFRPLTNTGIRQFRICGDCMIDLALQR